MHPFYLIFIINISVVRGIDVPNYSIAYGSNSMNTYLNDVHKHYVYAYLRESNHTPYYIGKGTGKRAWSKNHNVSLPKNHLIVIIADNLSDVWAIALERRLIRWYGRNDIGTGILYNRTDGGEGITKGTKLSEERRKQISLSMKNRKFSLKHRQRKSAAQTGSKNHMYGKKVHWWNDGIKSYFVEHCPTGCVPGRLLDCKSEKGPNYGKTWYNDRVKNYLTKTRPDNCVTGKIKR